MSVRPMTLRPVSPPGSMRRSSRYDRYAEQRRGRRSCVGARRCRPGGRRTRSPSSLASIAGHQLVAAVVVEPEQGRRRSAPCRRVGDLLGVDGDGAGRHRQGQLLAVAVEDRAALGRQRAGLAVHCCGGRAAQLVALERLQQADLDEHGREHEEHRRRGSRSAACAAVRPRSGSSAGGCGCGSCAGRAGGDRACAAHALGAARRAHLDRPLRPQPAPAAEAGRGRGATPGTGAGWLLAPTGRRLGGALCGDHVVGPALGASGSRRAARRRGGSARRPTGAPTRRGSSSGRCVLATTDARGRRSSSCWRCGRRAGAASARRDARTRPAQAEEVHQPPDSRRPP